MDKIRDGVSDDNDCFEYDALRPDEQFCAFTEVNVDNVTSLIARSKNKHCSLDPIPTNI